MILAQGAVANSLVGSVVASVATSRDPEGRFLGTSWKIDEKHAMRLPIRDPTGYPLVI